MKYMGSKSRIAKYILPIMLADRKPGQYWVEPFVGGGNIIDKVGGDRIGADLNPYVIQALILIRDAPESIPELITEDDYALANQTRDIDGLTGFISFAMSFGGKFFGGYRRDVSGTKGSLENMYAQTRRGRNSALKQSVLLQGVEFVNVGYSELIIPDNSIIYCDPPYRDTTKYKDDFDHPAFYQWCRDKAKEGHTVFVSEYSAPEDFQCVWEKHVTSSLRDKQDSRRVEKLYRVEH